jgi:redox-sensitive bicupin YhaK (pirin superfamily)
MTEPKYQHIAAEDVLRFEDDGMEVRVISGRYGEISGPAENIVQTDYFDVYLDKAKSFDSPSAAGTSRICYVHTGSIRLSTEEAHDTVHQGELVHIASEEALVVKGLSERSGFLFLSAAPNREPIVRGGPFVMNTSEEIAQAFVDYQNGTLHQKSS